MIDSEYEAAVCVIDALARKGVSLSLEDVGHLFGSTENDHLWEQLLAERTGGTITAAQLDAELMEVLPGRIDALPLLPGVLEVLDRAKRSGWAIGMATGQD